MVCDKIFVRWMPWAKTLYTSETQSQLTTHARMPTYLHQDTQLRVCFGLSTRKPQEELWRPDGILDAYADIRVQTY
jgi:hypothetical protein